MREDDTHGAELAEQNFCSFFFAPLISDGALHLGKRFFDSLAQVLFLWETVVIVLGYLGGDHVLTCSPLGRRQLIQLIVHQIRLNTQLLIEVEYGIRHCKSLLE